MTNIVVGIPKFIEKINLYIRKLNIQIKGRHIKHYKNMTEEINGLLVALFLSTGIIGWIIPINNISVLCTILITCIYILNNGTKNILSKDKFVFIICVFVWFILSTFNKNVYLDTWGKYLLYFIVFGITAFIITEKTFNKNAVYKYIMLLSFLALPYMISKQFFMNHSYKNPEQSVEIMIMSYTIIPIILACFQVISSKEFKKGYRIVAIIPFIIYMFLIISKSSRGPILALVVYFLLRVLFYKPSKDKIWIKITIILVLTISIVLCCVFMEQVLTTVKNVLDSMSIDSMFVDRMLQVLEEGDGSILSGRDEIYKEALDEISHSFIWGNGIGAFEGKYGHYVHNVVLQIICEGGIICIGYFIYLLYYLIRFLITEKKEEVTFLCFMTSIALVQLMISSYYWSSLKFWLLIGYIIYLKNRKKRGENK